MDDFQAQPRGPSRLDALSTEGSKRSEVNRAYTKFIRALRIILPLFAVALTVVVLTWEDAGRRVSPLQKQDVAPQADNVQNELLSPVFNSVDDKSQPFTVTADRATQDKMNSNILNLENPKAELQENDGGKLNAEANTGLYEQNTQKLNLFGNVVLSNSDGYTLTTEELRVDLVTQKAFSGRDVRVEGEAGTIDSTGLEGDGATGTLIFTGPAKVILNSGVKLSPQEN